MRLGNMAYNREDILRRTGDGSQLFGIRAMQYAGGDANLTRCYEVDTGAGLTFSVNESKCLDIYRMQYKGINLGFCSKAGLHSPYNADQGSNAFRYSQGCGMLYTAGITNVGGASEEDGMPYYTHGAIKNMAAQNVCACGEWQSEDSYRMRISGDMREAAFFGRSLHMHREITAIAGERRIKISDTIENRDFKPDHVMLLYHINTGFPLLDEGAHMVAPVREVIPATAYSEELRDRYATATHPLDNVEETLYTLRLGQDKDDMSAVALFNDKLALGLYVRFDAKTLNKFVEWRSMKSGDYALGMLPSNCEPFGREHASKTGGWTQLLPFEKMCTHVEIGVLEGAAEMASFRREVEAMR